MSKVEMTTCKCPNCGRDDTRVMRCESDDGVGDVAFVSWCPAGHVVVGDPHNGNFPIDVYCFEGYVGD